MTFKAFANTIYYKVFKASVWKFAALWCTSRADLLRLRGVAVALLWLLLSVSTMAAKDFVVTLDAGHGGHDYGAVGKKGNEKSITLAVATSLGQLIEKNFGDVKVVYTRDSDVFIPLDRRAAIANQASSDLFISIHVNSVDKKNRNRTHIEGCQVYTLGLHKTAENLAVAKRENAVMELEPDHTAKYSGFDPNSLESDIAFELSQSKKMDQSIEFADAVHHQLNEMAGRSPKGVRQAGFWVLWATSMPSVLVELDFICNPTSEEYLLSKEGQEEMVAALYNAFCSYYNTYAPGILNKDIVPAKTLTVNRKAAPAVSKKETVAPENASKDTARENDTHTETAAVAADSSVETYHVQILATSAPIAENSTELKGLKDVGYYRDGNMYKYFVGGSTSINEAKKTLKQVKNKFPQAFIIKMLNGQRIDFIKP